MEVHGKLYCSEWVTDAGRTICKKAMIGNPPCSVQTSDDCIFEPISLPEEIISVLGGAGEFSPYNGTLLVNLGRNEIVQNDTVFAGLGLSNDVTLTLVRSWLSKSELFSMFKRINVADRWDFSLQTFMKSTGFLSYQLMLSTIFLIMLMYRIVSCTIWVYRGYTQKNIEREKREMRKRRRQMDGRDERLELMTI